MITNVITIGCHRGIVEANGHTSTAWGEENQCNSHRSSDLGDNIVIVLTIIVLLSSISSLSGPISREPGLRHLPSSCIWAAPRCCSETLSCLWAVRQPIFLAPLILSRYLLVSLSYLICILYLGWGQWGAMGCTRITSLYTLDFKPCHSWVDTGCNLLPLLPNIATTFIPLTGS